MLNKVPKSVQPNVKTDLREIRDAPDRASAEVAIAVFQWKYGVKYPKAVHCLMKDRNPLLAFFEFPAEHWDHWRTANPIESVFATIRHRTMRTKGALLQKTAKLMVFKLVQAAAKTWRRLKDATSWQWSSRVSHRRRCHAERRQPRRLIKPRHPKSAIAPKIECILGITLPIFAIALIGFLYARSIKLNLSGANRISVDLALPALIFTSLSTRTSRSAKAACSWLRPRS